jgi:hypothetical protein
VNSSFGSIASASRREFCALAAQVIAASFLPRSMAAQTRPPGSQPAFTGTLAVDETMPIYTLPPDFTGLSYESAQLANPDFFSAKNVPLLQLFRELSPQGVLRLGGGSSEYTTYSELEPKGPPPFETFGPDTSKTVKNGTVTSALALRNLRAFLDAVNWTCLYGLNLGQGTKENAVAEAEAAHRILGPKLLALQIGNEPDSFGRLRPRTWGPDDYIREWIAFHDAILARVPDVKFAGPDISNKLSFLTAFAAIAPQHPDIVLLTDHYYAMGPAGNPAVTLDNLLLPQPRLTTLKWDNVPVIEDAMRTAKLPLRISECNSCWNGGMPGVSDVFASALWCADVMLHFASLGICGVNLHGGGNGVYSPIVGSPATGFSKRPEFYGIQFAQRFAGTTLLHTDLRCNSDRVSAYAARDAGGHGVSAVAVINKTDNPVGLKLQGAFLDQRNWHSIQLSADSLEAKTGITLKPVRNRLSAHTLLQVAPHSAVQLGKRVHHERA